MTGRMTRRQALGAAAVGGAGLVGGLDGSVEATIGTRTPNLLIRSLLSHLCIQEL